MKRKKWIPCHSLKLSQQHFLKPRVEGFFKSKGATRFSVPIPHPQCSHPGMLGHAILLYCSPPAATNPDSLEEKLKGFCWLGDSHVDGVGRREGGSARIHSVLCSLLDTL